MLSFFIKGLLIGFSIAAPVGPIGVLCIRRTLARGRLSGFVSGLGAATADAFYGLIAGFGLTIVSHFLISQQSLLKLVGGFFLLYIGFTTLRSIPSEKAASVKGKGEVGDYLSTLGLTITNPLTILSFVAIFAGLGIGNMKSNYLTSSILVLGVFIGSALWWFLLSGGIGFFRKNFTTRSLRIVNIISGIIIFGFGAFALGSLIHQ